MAPQEQRAAAEAAQAASDQQQRRAEEIKAKQERAAARGARLQRDFSALQARRPCTLPACLYPIGAAPCVGPSTAVARHLSMHMSVLRLPHLPPATSSFSWRQSTEIGQELSGLATAALSG